MKSTYEYKDYALEISKECRHKLYVLYRYPLTSVINFCHEFSDMIERNVVEDRGELILIGDYNIHMNSMNHPDTIIFSDCLDSLYLTNLVDFPMHKALHTLDLIICDRQSNTVLSVDKSHLLSDHNTITCKITPKTIMSFGKFKEINPRSANDIRTELESQEIIASQDNIITAYNNVVINALNKHALLRQK